MIPRLLALLITLSTLHAADDGILAALRAADEERIRATVAADHGRLNDILADDLRYAHSTGTVDTKTTLIDSITSGRTKYKSISYEERTFEIPTSGIALMTGRALVKVTTPDGDIESVLSFLAVWQEKNGKWRFRAWQSCKIPARTSASTPNRDINAPMKTLLGQRRSGIQDHLCADHRTSFIRHG